MKAICYLKDDLDISHECLEQLIVLVFEGAVSQFLHVHEGLSRVIVHGGIGEALRICVMVRVPFH